MWNLKKKNNNGNLSIPVLSVISESIWDSPNLMGISNKTKTQNKNLHKNLSVARGENGIPTC